MIKRLLSRMGIIRKGKANLGGDPTPPKQAPIKQISKVNSIEGLTEQEINFIVAKLRQATYQGSEFELFYKVISKLQNKVK
jgi:hypothetical protein